jgi:hypothetical protein
MAAMAAAPRKCNLWIHDANFSTEDVVVNPDVFPGVAVGQLLSLHQCVARARARPPAPKRPLTRRRGRSDRRPPERPRLILQVASVKPIKTAQHQISVSRWAGAPPGPRPDAAARRGPPRHVADQFGLQNRRDCFVETVRRASCARQGGGFGAR